LSATIFHRATPASTCFAACLATVVGVPLPEVPGSYSACRFGDECMYASYARFLARHGLRLLYVPFAEPQLAACTRDPIPPFGIAELDRQAHVVVIDACDRVAHDPGRPEPSFAYALAARWMLLPWGREEPPPCKTCVEMERGLVEG
jgi:hypothetical protein